MSQPHKLRALFLTFLKIGAFTFGGGYAMISLIEKETVENHKWVSDEDILNMLAIAESTPGPIAINSATFIGFHVAGFWGALCATLGVVTPSFLVISILSYFLIQFQNVLWVAWVLDGIRAGVVVLIINAVLKLAKQLPHNLFALFIALSAFLITTLSGINVILILLAAARCV